MTEDAKRYAEATFMKKKMYYNMRIKTIKRIFSAITKLCRRAADIKQDILYDNIAIMNKALALIYGNEKLKS
jgi:hypothetical protein